MIFLTLNICVPNKLQLNYNIAIYNITIFKISGWVTLLPEVELKTKDNIRKGSQKKTFFGLCNVFLCTMAHMTKCSRVIQHMREAGKITSTELNFSDIYMELLINNLISSRNLNHILTHGRKYHLCWDPWAQVGT